MQCADFERRLNMVLDQRRPAEEDAILQLHAAECADCQQLLSGQSRLLEMLRCEIISLPDDFAQRIVSVPTRSSGFSLRKAQIAAAILATAATLLIVAYPIAHRFNSSRPSARQNKNHPRQPAPTTIATWQSGAQATKEASAPLANAPLANSSAEPEEFRRMIHDIWQKLPAVPEEQLEPIDRLAGGFKPLASTIGAALDAIRRSLPVGREQEPAEPQANFLGWNSRVGLS